MTEARTRERLNEHKERGPRERLTPRTNTTALREKLASMTVDSPTDGEVFLAYLDHVLCPALHPGQVVVMDNLSVHKVEGVRQRIEAAGAALLYLPPYSPDFNPIERAFAKLKALLRAAATRTIPDLWDAIRDAIAQALQTISAQNAAAWFFHCGYGLH